MQRQLWTSGLKRPKYETLEADISCEILVIGGGMAGILTAYLLTVSGHDVVLVEGKSIGGGITQRTTAVITAQHDTLYSDLIAQHGYDKAKSYLEANLEALNTYKTLARDIDCDFEEKPSYMYSLDLDLTGEIQVLASLGFKALIQTSLPLPFGVKSAVEFPHMAQFHPLKFLLAIASRLRIYENTYVRKITERTAETDRFKISFQKAVVATHFPFINRTGFFFGKMFQQRSYVAALENAADFDGTYIDDTGSGLFFRNYDKYLLVGNGAHRTGTGTTAVEKMHSFIEEYFPRARIAYEWSNQDCVTLDSIPYVGRYGSFKDIYVLTGFNLWGMTGSMVGAKILDDLISDRSNSFSATFQPKRSLWRKQLWTNAGSSIVNLVNFKTKRCPHLGCALKYNRQEHTWDCPCHGSRFDDEGKLLTNPAMKDARIE